MKKLFFSLLAVTAITMSAVAESMPADYTNAIITAMPSLSIAPDAHAGAMGDVGAATTPDLNSQHWNPAKYVFMDSKGGITANYTPWLSKLVSDIDLAYLAGYYKITDNDAISASFTYFSLGEVAMTNGSFDWDSNVGTSIPENAIKVSPNEWALDLGYSRKLHEYVSMAVALRFMYSDLNNGIKMNDPNMPEMKAGFTAAADVALFYKQPIQLPMGESYFGLGFNLSNLGGKISYTEDTKNFIPANMRLGVSYEIPFDQYNRLQLAVDVNKYLVPTTKSTYTEGYDKNNKNQTWNMDKAEGAESQYSKTSSPKGWFMSFNDAPYGAREELQEVQLGAGLEYSYDRKFFARVGYSHEAKSKGNRRYATLGAGFHLSIVTLDVAYVIATAASNPLDQTLRFSLGFDLAGIKDLVNNRR